MGGKRKITNAASTGNRTQDHFWISFKEPEWFGSEFQNSLKKEKVSKNSQKNLLKKMAKNSLKKNH